MSTFNEYKSKSNNDFLDSIFVTGEVAAHFIDIINTANQAFSINDFEIFLEAKFFEIAESDLDHDDIELLLTYITIYQVSLNFLLSDEFNDMYYLNSKLIISCGAAIAAGAIAGAGTGGVAGVTIGGAIGRLFGKKVRLLELG